MRVSWAWGIGVSGLALLELLLVSRGLWLGPRGAFAHLAGTDSQTVFLVLGAVGICELAVVGWLAVARGQRDGAVIALIALGMFYGAFRHLDGLKLSNARQVTIIRRLHKLVPPSGHVLDGFTGLAALRRHAYYFCWINEYSGALMSPEDRDERLLAVLQKSPPDAVLFDEHLQRLPDSVTGWVREHYRPVFDEVPDLMIRR